MAFRLTRFTQAALLQWQLYDVSPHPEMTSCWGRRLVPPATSCRALAHASNNQGLLWDCRWPSLHMTYQRIEWEHYPDYLLCVGEADTWLAQRQRARGSSSWFLKEGAYQLLHMSFLDGARSRLSSKPELQSESPGLLSAFREEHDLELTIGFIIILVLY